MLRFVVCVFMVVAVALAENVKDLRNPCPGKFEYEEAKPGEWKGTLILNTDYSLHGLWLRVFFNIPIKDIKSNGEVKDVRTTDNDGKNFLLYNREVLLKKNTPTKMPFTVIFEGDERPELIGYRINGRAVCPEDSD